MSAIITAQLEATASLLQGMVRLLKWAAKHVETR